MLDKHTTRDGETMLICQMDDNHLLNTIKLFSRNLPQLWEIAEGELQRSAADEIYGVPEDITPDEARRFWRTDLNRVIPYLAEAMLRDSIRKAVGEFMQEQIGRTGPIRKKPRLKQALLVEGSSLDYDDDLPF